MANNRLKELLQRPTIRLVGELVNNRGNYGSNFSENVSHSISFNPDATKTIGGADQLNKDDVLLFKDLVRVIITGNISPKPTYVRQDRKLGSLEFEGKTKNTGSIINTVAETYYTLNGKTPVRTAAYPYRYKDWDDYTSNTNPSNDDSNNTGDLGFELKYNLTGDNNITIKARTFYQGNMSHVAIVHFRIYQSTTDTITIKSSNNND